MPLYYFDVDGTAETAPGSAGIDLTDDWEARDQAVSLLPGLARLPLLNGDQHKVVATARNAHGEVIFEASLALNGTWWPSGQQPLDSERS